MTASMAMAKRAKRSGKRSDDDNLCPYRSSSGYAIVWRFLCHATIAHGGITRDELIRQVALKLKTTKRLAAYSVHVVASVPETEGDGRNSNLSARHAGDVYWVRRHAGGRLEMVLRKTIH